VPVSTADSVSEVSSEPPSSTGKMAPSSSPSREASSVPSRVASELSSKMPSSEVVTEHPERNVATRRILRTHRSWRFQALAATAYARASVRAWILVFVATFTMAISYVDRQTLSVLAPTVTKQLGIGETGYGFPPARFP
jgi:hypothetical protein